MPQPDSTLDDRAVGDRELHAKSPQWLQALGAAGVERDQAAVRQHQLLLRIARNEVHRRGAQTPITGPELDDLAHQAAGDALLAIGGKLDQFRGESRFTTWAYKFVIFEVSGKLARHFWLQSQRAYGGRALGPAAGPIRARPAAAAESRELIARCGSRSRTS